MIEELSWEEARPLMLKANKELVDIIDEISPDKHHTLIKATYRYGDDILKNGVLQLPDYQGSVSIDSSSISARLKNQLNYSSIPLGLTIDKRGELFIQTKDRIIPLTLLERGEPFGIFETTNFINKKIVTPLWSMTMGSRTLFSLPKINDAIGLKRIKLEFNIPSTLGVRTLNDHWQLFKELANSQESTECWSGQVLLFTRKWLTYANDPKWFKFFGFISKYLWMQTGYPLKRLACAVLWQDFINAISQRNLKPRPYLSDTAKHLLFIAARCATSISPAIEAEENAPIKMFQNILIDTYSLKNYIPTFMQLTPASGSDNSFIYYSLSYPTFLEGSSASNVVSKTIISDLRDIKLLIDTLMNKADIHPMNKQILENIAFNYYHIEEDIYKEILSSQAIIKTDKRFQEEAKIFPNRSFCDTSLFWRGCIQMQLT